jgi:uncharacterized protein
VIDPIQLVSIGGLGVFAGTFGSLVGVGGGVIVVPILTVFFGVPLKTAVAASLIGVIAISLAGGSRYLAAGTVDRRLGLVLLAASSSGAVLGGMVAGALDAAILSGVFGVVLLLVAAQVVRTGEPAARPSAAGGTRSSYVEPKTGATVEYRPERIGLGLAISAVTGSLSALLGIGGGVINVPTMATIMGVPFRVAVATSTYMLGTTAAVGGAAYYARGQLDPFVAAPVALGIIAGAQMGSRLAPRVSAIALRRLFAGLCVVLAIQMLLKAL